MQDEGEVVEAIYLVAAGGLWAPLLPKITAFIGAPSAAYQQADVIAGASLEVFATHEVDTAISTATVAAIAAGEGRDDISPAMMRTLDGDTTRVATARAALAREDLHRTWFWNENMVPSGVTDIAGLILDDSPTTGPVVLSLLHRGAGGFSGEQVARYAAIASHLRRAARTQRRSRGAWRPSPTLAQSLDASPTACILLGEAGRVLFANSAAQDLLHRPLFRYAGARLTARDPAQDRALQAMLAGAVGLGLGNARVGGELILHEPDGARLLVTAVPAGPDNLILGGGSAVRAAVQLLPEGAPRTAAVARLALAFDLTPAESEILTAVLQNQTPDEIARRRGRSLATVRTQVARLLDKAHVGRVEALVSLAHRLGPPA